MGEAMQLLSAQFQSPWWGWVEGGSGSLPLLFSFFSLPTQSDIIALDFWNWINEWHMRFMETVLLLPGITDKEQKENVNRRFQLNFSHCETLIFFLFSIWSLKAQIKLSVMASRFLSIFFFHACQSAGLPPVSGFSRYREDIVEVLGNLSAH